eukprot:2068409-Prymnesium_polylepis.1
MNSSASLLRAVSLHHDRSRGVLNAQICCYRIGRARGGRSVCPSYSHAAPSHSEVAALIIYDIFVDTIPCGCLTRAYARRKRAKKLCGFAPL